MLSNFSNETITASQDPGHFSNFPAPLTYNIRQVINVHPSNG